MYSPKKPAKRPGVTFATHTPDSDSDYVHVNTTKPVPILKKPKPTSKYDNIAPSHCPRSPPRCPRSPPASSNTRPVHRPGPQTAASAAPVPAPLSDSLFTHTVTNTPQGLIIDGILRPRGATHTNPHDPPSLPPYYHNIANPQVNMSTVGAGLMPDPNTAHFQPPVASTANGPFQHTYVPRNDAYQQQYMMPFGAAAPGGPPFCAPSAFPYQQPQTGMATAPIPMMAPGSQPPFVQPPHMQGPPMQGPPINLQPGPMHPMAYGPGIGQPTPPMTPPAPFFGGGNYGGWEMGKTQNEVAAENRYKSQHNQMNEAQGIKPADDDVSRMYWCRELDGEWTSRSRFSLDRMGNFRWYVTADGVFYAKMLVE